MSRGGERVTKVFLDSRMSLPDGPIQIPGGGILLDPSNRCWLGEFSTVASWNTIDESNGNMYILEQLGNDSLPRLVEPHWGPYDLDTLITGITSALNGPGKLAGLGTYSTTRVSVGNSAATGVMARAYQLDLSRGSFQIPPDEDVRTVWLNGNKDAETKSLNRIFSFPSSTGWVSSAKSTFVDLRRRHQIFIHTPGFGNYNSMGPKGQRDILAKVPVDVGYGGSIHWYMSGSEHDSVEVGVKRLSALKIQLKGVDGNLIDLQGGQWSATLIFDK